MNLDEPNKIQRPKLQRSSDQLSAATCGVDLTRSRNASLWITFYSTEEKHLMEKLFQIHLSRLSTSSVTLPKSKYNLSVEFEKYNHTWRIKIVLKSSNKYISIAFIYGPYGQ